MISDNYLWFTARKIKVGNSEGFIIPKAISKMVSNDEYKVFIKKNEVSKNEDYRNQ